MAITTTLNKNKDIKLTKNFMLSEFACKDGSTLIKYSPELVKMLQQIIDRSNVITIGKITSGYRTPNYSVKVGGTANDTHTLGLAVDIQFKDKNKKIIPIKYICCFAQDLGFGGIGAMKNSVHLDIRHLGGYKNRKWYGDETTNYSLTQHNVDFYKYYKLTKDEVYKYLQITTVGD